VGISGAEANPDLARARGSACDGVSDTSGKPQGTAALANGIGVHESFNGSHRQQTPELKAPGSVRSAVPLTTNARRLSRPDST
jgi:hypothetical protein